MPTCAVAEFAFDIKSWTDVGVQEPKDVALRVRIAQGEREHGGQPREQVERHRLVFLG